MNKITLCVFIALIAVIACIASVAAQAQEQPVNSATLLRTLARKLYPGASDSQIIAAVFPKRGLRRAAIAKKPIANIVQALSDAASRDCASECRGSGASCYQHCNQYRFKI